MSVITVPDVLSDPDMSRAVSSGLVVALSSAYSNAQLSGHDSLVQRTGYSIKISRHGDINVEIENGDGFSNWCSDAGQLAFHVGPEHDPVSGRSVEACLGHDEEMGTLSVQDPPPAPEQEAADVDADSESDQGPSWGAGLPPLHWAGWSPRLTPKDGGEVPDLTVDIGQVVPAWRCDGCGAASSDPADFEVHDQLSRPQCECGGIVSQVPAVYCDSCDTLILLRSTNPVIGDTPSTA